MGTACVVQSQRLQRSEAGSTECAGGFSELCAELNSDCLNPTWVVVLTFVAEGEDSVDRSDRSQASKLILESICEKFQSSIPFFKCDKSWSICSQT